MFVNRHAIIKALEIIKMAVNANQMLIANQHLAVLLHFNVFLQQIQLEAIAHSAQIVLQAYVS